jgi:phosphoribosylaminoimidazole-succinocarboxamide synthase
MGPEEDFTKIDEGKTKAIHRFTDDSGLCIVSSSDRITAKNGKQSDIIVGKGALSNQVTCNVFHALVGNGIPLAFKGQNGPTSFVASYCDMVPLEVVGRFRAGPKSSFLKRYPNTPVNKEFNKPIIEFFLKTTGQKWKDADLPCDDPYLSPWKMSDGLYNAHPPDEPTRPDNVIARVSEVELRLRPNEHEMTFIRNMTEKVAYALRDIWNSVGVRTDDFKIEFGRDRSGRLVVADVLDFESARIWLGDEDLSKQPYRDGEPLGIVFAKFKTAAELSEHFAD